ncbi:MAG TPA: hypothetical protein VHM27_04660 [Rhizomicrobium sp.]|jgi:hypothetical protein|nr:hypothetical protein [Rhizomicrobium sp.]
MKHILTAAAAAALLACAAPALAQDIPTPEQVIADNDKNGDGAIDKMEWANSPAPFPFPDEFDANKDGKIDLAELKALFASFQNGGAPPPPAPPAPQQAAPQG